MFKNKLSYAESYINEQLKLNNWSLKNILSFLFERLDIEIHQGVNALFCLLCIPNRGAIGVTYDEKKINRHKNTKIIGMMNTQKGVISSDRLIYSILKNENRNYNPTVFDVFPLCSYGIVGIERNSKKPSCALLIKTYGL